MNDSLRWGRQVGGWLLAILVIGMGANLLLHPALFDDGGLLVNAARQPTGVGVAVLLDLVTGLLSVWVAVLVLGRLQGAAPGLGRFYFAVVVAGLVLSLVEAVTLYAFLPLSALHQAAGHVSEAMRAASATLTGLRNGVHVVDTLLGGIALLSLFLLFGRSRALPRALAWFGVGAAALQCLTLTWVLLGGAMIAPLLAPLALAFVLTASYLLIRGGPDMPDAAMSGLMSERYAPAPVAVQP